MQILDKLLFIVTVTDIISIITVNDNSIYSSITVNDNNVTVQISVLGFKTVPVTLNCFSLRNVVLF